MDQPVIKIYISRQLTSVSPAVLCFYIVREIMFEEIHPIKLPTCGYDFNRKLLDNQWPISIWVVNSGCHSNMEVSLLLYVPDVASSPGPSESTISGPRRSFDPRPSPNFSPRLRDKIWEGPGDEAIPDVQAPVATPPFWCPSLQVCYPLHSVINTQRSNFHFSSLLSNRFRGTINTDLNCNTLQVLASWYRSWIRVWLKKHFSMHNAFLMFRIQNRTHILTSWTQWFVSQQRSPWRSTCSRCLPSWKYWCVHMFLYRKQKVQLVTTPLLWTFFPEFY